MSRRWLTVSSSSLLSLSLFLASCAMRPTTTDAVRREYIIARDGILQFSLPPGWFNASNDAHTPDETIWLVRNDYAATISVRIVNMDDDARRILHREGVLRLAELTMGLNAQVVITRRPEMIRAEGKEYCAYEALVAPENDAIRVALIDTGTRVYEVRALASEKGSPAGVFTAQDEFLRRLRW